MSRRDLKIVEPRVVRAPDGRLPPHDMELEQRVLASALAGCFHRIANILTAEDFYNPANGLIWKACEALHADDLPTTPALVLTYLIDRDQILKGSIDHEYLVELELHTPDVSTHIEVHAIAIARKARRRRLIAECQMIAAEGYGDVGDDDDWSDGAVERVTRIAAQARFATAEGIDTIVGRAVATGDQRAVDVCVSTGIQVLDEALCGGLFMRESSFVTGKTGRGKSALAGCIAMNVAAHVGASGAYDQGVLYIQLEDDREATANRMIVSAGRIDAKRYKMWRAGLVELTAAEYAAVLSAADWVSRLPIEIDDTKELSIADIDSRIARSRQQHERAGRKLALVVVDNLQLVDGTELVSARDNREVEVSRVAHRLQRLSERHNLHVMIPAQVHDRDPNPDLWTIRESSGAERHNKLRLDLRRSSEEGLRVEECSVRISKQRHGPFPLNVPFWFHAWCLLFSDEARPT